MSDTPRERIEAWLEEAVIGLDLCPFAAAPYRDGTVRIAVSEAVDFDPAIQAALEEVDRLLDCEAEEMNTTLVAYPEAFGEFREFLEAAEVLRELLSRAGCDGVLQVATFHPDYQFAGTEPEDVGNYTNRAPFPVLHLLRESEVSKAVDRHPDPEGIPERNVEKLGEIGRDRVEALFEQWSD